MTTEPKGLWLLVDDEKNLKADLVARTYAQGQDLLRKHIDQIAVLMLDYWLGGSRTGGDFIEWFLAEKLLPARVQLVSSDLWCRTQQVKMLEKAGYREGDEFPGWCRADIHDNRIRLS